MSESKSAIITGASSGMGLEYSRQLAAKGYQLLMISNRAEELSEAAEAFRKEYGVRIESLCLDLATQGAAAKVLEWTDSTGLEPSVLINNAGMFFMEYLSAENLPKADAMLGLHIKTATDLCILFGMRMKAAGGGCILNMSSVTARIPAPGIAIYSASKAYLKSFGKSLHYELRPFGVKVSTVCPAAVDTGLYNLSPGLRRTLRRLGLMQTPQRLVSRGLKAMFRGRCICSPGIMNPLLPPLIAILPASLIARLGMKWIYTPTIPERRRRKGQDEG